MSCSHNLKFNKIEMKDKLKEKSKNYIIKYFFVLLLVLSALILSIYALILTPFLYQKHAGIFFTSFISLVLWTLFSHIFRNTFDFEIENEEELEKIKDNESCLVISNHIGAIDFMVINEISKKKKMLKHSKYMIKESIKYIPVLGHIRFLGFIMMKRNFEKDKASIINWLQFFKFNLTPIWFVIFPEGSRFSNKKLEQCKLFCATRNLTPMKNVLYPRSKGFKVTIKELEDSYIEHIIDLTIYYHELDKINENVPSLFSFLSYMPRGKIKVKIEVKRINEVENPEEFLRQSFIQKDQTIEKWREKMILEMHR